MKILWFLLAGVAGGLMGGMGFGGGMLLIPLLTFLLDVPPKLAAWINLVVFLPMGTVALVVHKKNRFVDLREAIFLFLFAFLGAVVVFLFGKDVSDALYRRAFGWFLLSVGALSVISVLCGFSKQK